MEVLIRQEEDEGLRKLLGKKVTLFCMNYFYTGELVGINDECVKLKDPSKIYETGHFSSKDWENAESLGVDEWYVNKAAIESFGVMKC